LAQRPNLPGLEALRIRMGPRLEGKLITAASVAPKKAHCSAIPSRSSLGSSRREASTRSCGGKHLVFATELGGGGSPRCLVINPMLGGRFQLASDGEAVPATHVFTIVARMRSPL